MIPPIWERQTADPADVDRLSRALGLEPVIARLLVMRGLTDPDAAARFLKPSLDQLHDPSLLAGMRRGNGAHPPGTRPRASASPSTATTTWTASLPPSSCAVTLELLGGNVGHFIPDRLKDGYGLQPATIDRLHAEGARLVISVDCGIRGEDAALRARELGLDLIITDHHEPGAALPPALAVINPKRSDCAYPEKNLAGVGVALKLVQALCAAHGQEPAGSRLRQDRRARHAGRRRSARRREQGHREDRTRPAVAAARTRWGCGR